jgi:hypothetical protein
VPEGLAGFTDAAPGCHPTHGDKKSKQEVLF